MTNESNVQPSASMASVVQTKLADCPYPNPTPEMLNDPRFEAIWQAIKDWDLERTRGAGYAGATGSDVCWILNALDASTQVIN